MLENFRWFSPIIAHEDIELPWVPMPEPDRKGARNMLAFRSVYHFSEVAAVAVVAVACAAMTQEEGSGGMNLHAYCKETICERDREECLQRVGERCDECFDICADPVIYDVSDACLGTCDRACDSTSCYAASCETSPCAERGFEFELADTRDAVLYEACLHAVTSSLSCENEEMEEELIYLACDNFARVYDPQISDELECTADLDCEADPNSCWTEPPQSGTLGDESCARMEDLCDYGSCNEQWRKNVNWIEPILRPDVSDALRLCFGETTCNDMEGCFNAWAEAVNL